MTDRATRRAALADQPPEITEGEAITGEPVVVDAIIQSAESAAADRSDRKARTGQQAFQATIVVTIAVWLARLNGVDLNPLPDVEEIPAEVAAAWGGLITYFGAAWMNRQPR